MKPETETVREEIRQFRAGRQTVVLATVGTDGHPLASYAPFIEDEQECLYVYLSRLARHTAHLLASSTVGVMYLEDEAGLRNPFARRRLVLQCTVEPVYREDPGWADTLGRFESRFGPTVRMLRQLPDFELFRLRPTSGDYVRGFGQAYRLEGAGLTQIVHVAPPK